VGTIAARLEGARVVLYDGARRTETADPAEILVIGSRVKYLVQEAVVFATNACIELVGARSIGRGHLIERAYRDVRTASLMPPNVDRMEQILGSAFLAK
jgi:alkylation response protein AidB-like acyl-CoA dehydrogenase